MTIKVSALETEKVSGEKTKIFNSMIKLTSDKSTCKITSSQLAKKMGLKTNCLIEKLVNAGFLEIRLEKYYLTTKGKESGGEARNSPKLGPYFLWPEDFLPS